MQCDQILCSKNSPKKEETIFSSIKQTYIKALTETYNSKGLGMLKSTALL
jgi:hypothetical protein